jgi:hypothetical protein
MNTGSERERERERERGERANKKPNEDRIELVYLGLLTYVMCCDERRYNSDTMTK